MGEVLSEALGIRMAQELAVNTAPATGWVVLQPDVGGISGWRRMGEYIERDIHSVNATMEKGDEVGHSTSPTLTHDFNKDLCDLIAPSAFRCTPKHAGGGLTSQWRDRSIVAGANPHVLVDANGALAANMLIFNQGYDNAINNGAHLVVAGATATELRVSTALVAEVPTGPTSTDIAGYQGTAGDIRLDVSGHLTSVVKDLTQLGLAVGQRIKLGGATAITQFATAAYNGLAYVKSIAANLVQLERHSWTPAAADLGAAKTIQILFTRFYRNYPINTTGYAIGSLHGEKETPGAGVDGTTRYMNVKGCVVSSLALSAPLKQKITATVNMVGLNATTPVGVAGRVAGPSSAFQPVGVDLTDTSNDLRLVRLMSATGAVIARVNSWNLTINNGAKIKYAQGDGGDGFGFSFGKFAHELSMEVFFEDADAFATAANNTSLYWDVVVANGQFGYSLCLPHVALRDPEDVYAANEPVMLKCNLPAFRQASTGIAGSLSVFAYYPPRV